MGDFIRVVLWECLWFMINLNLQQHIKGIGHSLMERSTSPYPRRDEAYLGRDVEQGC